MATPLAHMRYSLCGLDLTGDETRAVDAEAYRRLRRTTQLPNACSVYPATVHGRLEHALGAADAAGPPYPLVLCMAPRTPSKKAVLASPSISRWCSAVPPPAPPRSRRPETSRNDDATSVRRSRAASGMASWRCASARRPPMMFFCCSAMMRSSSVWAFSSSSTGSSGEGSCFLPSTQGSAGRP